MQSDELYYRQSGRFNSTAPLGILIPGVIVALIAGAVYGAAVFLIPFIYINFLLTFALGGVIGWVVYKLSVSQHVRNAKLALLFGFLAGLAAEYAAFVGWVFAISEWEYFAIWPADLWLAVTALGENGVWTLFGGDPVSGLWLYAVWLIEFLMIVCVASLVPLVMITPMVYCEQCHQWADDHETILPFEPVENAAAMQRDLENGEFAVLGSIKPVGADAAAYTEFELLGCSGCDDLHVLTVNTIKLETNKKGEVTKHTDVVVQNLLIDSESRQLIAALAPAEEPEPAAADPDAVVEEASTPAE